MTHDCLPHQVPFATWEARQAAAAVAFHNVRPALPEATPPRWARFVGWHP